MAATTKPVRPPSRRKSAWLWALPSVGLVMLVIMSVIASTSTPLRSLALSLGAPDPPTPAATPATRQRGRTLDGHYLFSPEEIRDYYGITPLIQHGNDGRGQTIVVIVSFGHPNLLGDLATFSQTYHLPPADIRVLAPLGEVQFDPSNAQMAGWSRETEEDVETIHAVAPGAKIVVLTSPVSQNQGTIGLGQLLQLERYALDNHLGTVFSMSWGTSESSLDTPDGRAQIAQWDSFFRTATREGITFLASSGDHGATDYADDTMHAFARTPTTNFPASDPYVTGVGGTKLAPSGVETAWERSGGGISRFFSLPPYQARLAPGTLSLLGGHRGVPDVSANGERDNGLGILVNSGWKADYGTSASTPLWAGLIAIANQMRGKPLGELNTLLYQVAASPAYATDLRDMTIGNNSWQDVGFVVTGYSAGTGWDAISGLGTPRADRLLPDLIDAANQRDNASPHGGF
ncbi:MAG TPA: S53 family peptidase [Ktedonobacterales bacterium]